MTSPQQHHLLWLASAMTIPIYYVSERHYYDSRFQVFFTKVSYGNCGARFDIKDVYGSIMYKELSCDISVRLELINDDGSEIVEIPKLNVKDKIAIRTDFLKHFEGVVYYDELLEAISRQQYNHRFALDTVLIENDNAAPMALYWDDYKLNVVMEYISRFANAVGLTLPILNL
jgi:hypothetical protein